MKKTHYEVLGVAPTSTPHEVRSAYRKLVLKYHPDRSSDPRSADLLIQVVAAYEVLGDKTKRSSYDADLNLAAARAEARTRDSKPKEPAPTPKPPRARTATIPKEDPVAKLTSLFTKGKFDEAEKLAYAILDSNHREPVPYAVLGDISRARGDLAQALNMYAHAVQAAPGNATYQRRYEDLLSSSSKAAVAQSTPLNAGAIFLGCAICVCAAAYIALSKESPLFASLGPVNSWTLGLVAMLLLCGITAGVTLSVCDLVDRFNAVTKTSLGKIGPAMAVGIVSLLNFWLAAGLYVFMGMRQAAFNYSTSRAVSSAAAITLLLALSAHFSQGIDGLQVLLWGGTLAYIGLLCGWMVADSMKKE